MKPKKIIDIICNSISPERVFLVGYRDWNAQYFNIFHDQEIGRFPSDPSYLDILIVGARPKESTLGKMATALSGLAYNTVLVIEPDSFIQHLKRGSFFAIRSVEAGFPIFVNENAIELQPNHSATKLWKFEAEKSALHIHKMADEFVKTARLYRSNKNDFQKLSLYFLKQAFDLYLRSAIAGILGIEFEVKNNTGRLIHIARWTRPEIAKVLKPTKKQNQTVLELFETAFHNPPWDRHFFTESCILQAAREKVLDLRDTVLPFLLINAKEQFVEGIAVVYEFEKQMLI